MGAAFFILPPGEFLEGDSTHRMLDQPGTRDPATIAAFDRRVTDVVVDADPAGIEALEDVPEIPYRGTYHSGSGVGVIHAADLMFLVEFS